MDEYEKCIADPDVEVEVIADMEDARRNAGVTGTPGFVVGEQVVSGAQSFATFEKIIEEELKKN